MTRIMCPPEDLMDIIPDCYEESTDNPCDEQECPYMKRKEGEP